MLLNLYIGYRITDSKIALFKKNLESYMHIKIKIKIMLRDYENF